MGKKIFTILGSRSFVNLDLWNTFIQSQCIINVLFIDVSSGWSVCKYGILLILTGSIVQTGYIQIKL